MIGDGLNSVILVRHPRLLVRVSVPDLSDRSFLCPIDCYIIFKICEEHGCVGCCGHGCEALVVELRYVEPQVVLLANWISRLASQVVFLQALFLAGGALSLSSKAVGSHCWALFTITWLGLLYSKHSVASERAARPDAHTIGVYDRWSFKPA